MTLRVKSYLQPIPATRKVDAGIVDATHTDWQDIFDSMPMLRSEVADGAAAVAAYIDTTTAWANAAARLYSWRSNAVEKAYLLANGRMVAASFGGIQAADVPDLSATYATAGHNHDATYSLLGHNHNATYSLLGHNHDASYAALAHAHAAADITSGTLATARLGSGVADNTKFLRGDSSWQVIDLSTYLTIASAAATYSVLAHNHDAAYAAIAHAHAAADITSGVVATARLGTGTADATTFLRGDGSWQAVSVSGYLALAGGTMTGDITLKSGSVFTDYANGKVSIAGTTPMFALGGSTASFPAWKRSGVLLEARLADDSAATGILAGSGSSTTPGYNFAATLGGDDTGIYYDGSLDFQMLFAIRRVPTFGLSQKGIHLPSGKRIGWASGGGIGFSDAFDIGLARNAAGVLEVNNGTAGVGASLQFWEQAAPAAPAANGARLYAEDNGSGKTRIMALFATGATQVIATEP